MKSKVLVGFVILFFLASCSGREKERSGEKLREKGEALSGAALDAIDLAIVMYAQRSSFNPVSLSSNIQQRLSKYGKGTTFKMSQKNIMVPFLKDGVKIIIPPGGEFVCKYEGEIKYSIILTEGEVGILNKNIYVKDGTKVQVDTGSYVFLEGKWKKSKTEGIRESKAIDVSELALEGIIYSGENNKALIANKKTQETYLLGKDEFLGEIKVEEIGRDKVTLEHHGQKIDLFSKSPAASESE